MRRSLALLISAGLFAAACTQSPTAATRTPSIRFDGGNTLGSGNVTGGGSGSTNSGGGGIFIGGGFTTGSGDAVSDSVASSGDGGGIFIGGG